jgi:hypothetical protein
MTTVIQLAFMPALVIIADIQARMIGADKVIRHFWWGCLFGALILAGWWISGRNYWLAGALVVEHFIFFAPVLNYLRTPRKPFFYISSQPKKGSIWDRLLIKIEPAYPFIWAAALVGFTTLQFFL